MSWNPFRKDKPPAPSPEEEGPGAATAPESDRTDPLVVGGGFKERASLLREAEGTRLEVVEIWGESGLSDSFLRLTIADDGRHAAMLREFLPLAPERASGFRDLLLSDEAALAAAFDRPQADLAALGEGEIPGDGFLRPLDLLEGLHELSQLCDHIERSVGWGWAEPTAAHVGLSREEPAAPAAYRRWRFAFTGWDVLREGAVCDARQLVELFLPAFSGLQARADEQGLAYCAGSLTSLTGRLSQLAALPGLTCGALAGELESWMPRFTVLGFTDVGRARDHNEDAYVALDLMQESASGAQLSLAAVADGMGGHLSGEVASSLTLDLLKQQLMLSMLAPRSTPLDPWQLPNQLASIIPAIDRALSERAALDPTLGGMGTTLCGLAALRPLTTAAPDPGSPPVGWTTVVFSVGDSRAYLLGPTGLQPLTHDHSYVQELLDQGSITREEAHGHQLKNVITRCLGGNSANATPDIFSFAPGPAELVLLTSDGLTDVLRDSDILRVAGECPGSDLAELARALVAAANAAGGPDNITVVAVGMGL